MACKDLRWTLQAMFCWSQTLDWTIGMQIGYLLDTSIGEHDGSIPRGADAARKIELLVREAKAAESAGFDSILVPERHMRGECVMPDPLTLLTVLAVETQSIALGTGATVLTLHNPMEFAERVALIDLISGGRVFVTLARGFNTDYWRMMGIPTGQVTRRFAESVEIVKRAWQPGGFSYRGEIFKFEDVFISPPPFHPGGPTVWGGGHSLSAIRRAGTYADCWLAGFFPVDDARWGECLDVFRNASLEHGNAGKVALIRAGFIASTRGTALRTFERHILQELRYYQGRQKIQPHYGLENPSSDDLRRNLVIGSPAECVEALVRCRDELTVESVVLRLRSPTGPTMDETLEAICQFGDEVLSEVAG